MNRIVPLLIAAASLGSCTMAPPPPPVPNPQLSHMLAGKVAGPPQRCISGYRSENIVPLDAYTIAVRDGSTTWVSHVRGRCTGLGVGYTLVTRSHTPALCSGDLAQVVDTSAGVPVGSCAFGDFIPFRPAGYRR